MDIDRFSFYPHLPQLLTDISNSHFVALDLELSGVVSKDSYNPPSTGKPTLQQRYIETKEAAERYQILQIGLTCVTHNAETGAYVLKPYNFNLCPIINERGIDVERIFSFQSGAVEFLLKVGFDMNRPFERGVPYLSESEATAARTRHARRQDKSALADIQLKPTETESLAFLERVRAEINAWSTAPRKPYVPDYLNILAQPEQDELSRFEKRLVHQLVRAEYPQLVTVSKRGFIQIVRFNQQREDRIMAERQRELDDRINRQKGFCWILDALQGRLAASGIDLKECAKDRTTGEVLAVDLDTVQRQLADAEDRLAGNPRVLVGHNCFLDLVYIYRAFVGPLPDTVEEFQEQLHALWPVVVDTKYMSTHNCGDINPVSSLEQIAAQLGVEQTPVVTTDPAFAKYEGITMFHEAGFDSFLTAQIAVRLSAKLERQGTYVAEGLARLGLGSGGKEQGSPKVTGRKTADDLMPPFDSVFWSVYGNRLRVFGTEEGFCELAPAAAPAAAVAAPESESDDADGEGGVGV